MQKKIIALTVLALLPSTSKAAEEAESVLPKVTFQTSPFESCKEVALISTKDFNKNKDFWNKAMYECGINVQVMPDAGYFSSLVNMIGVDQYSEDDAKRATNFLKGVGERAAKYAATNAMLAENTAKCAAGDKAWFDAKKTAAKSKAEEDFYTYENCEEALKDHKKAIAKIGPEARVKKAILLATLNPWESLKSAAKSGAKGSGVEFPGEDMPITEEEKAKAAKIVADMDAQIEKEYSSELAKHEKTFKVWEAQKAKDPVNAPIKPNVPSWFIEAYRESGQNINSPFIRKRAYSDAFKLEKRNKIIGQHADDFTKLLSQVPALGYLKSAEPTNADIADANLKVLKNAESEKEKIEKLIRIATGEAKINHARGAKLSYSLQQRVDGAKELMAYGPVVRELLGETPANCQIATALTNDIARVKGIKGAGMMAGLLGGAVVGGVAGASAAGSVLGVGLASALGGTVAASPFVGMFYEDAWRNFADTRQRAFSTADVVTERKGVDGNVVKGRALAEMKEYEDAKSEFLTQVALSPLDLLGTGVGKGTALAAGVGLASIKPAAKASLTRALRSKGIPEGEIAKLFADLASKNGDVAGAAAARITKEIGADTTTVKAIRSAASKGLFKEKSPEAIAAISKELSDANVAQRATDIFLKVNAAKVNVGNREQIWDVAIAGAKFGAEPNALAAKMGDWTEGLDGLGATYRRASELMAQPQFANKPLKERQEAAFRAALNEFRQNNSELKALSNDAWKVEEEKLIACGLPK